MFYSISKSMGLLMRVILPCFLSINSFAANFSLESHAFRPNTKIPQQYTCKGEDISPPLFWKSVPENTESFVLIVDDVDAPDGDWVHWLLFNIPANVHSLPKAAALPEGAVSGANSWGEAGYRGPCPPNGSHRYYFRLFALDTVLDLKASVTKQEVFDAMKNHVLGTSELMGIYTR